MRSIFTAIAVAALVAAFIFPVTARAHGPAGVTTLVVSDGRFVEVPTNALFVQPPFVQSLQVFPSVQVQQIQFQPAIIQQRIVVRERIVVRYGFGRRRG